MTPTTLTKEQNAYRNMVAVAKMLEALSPKGLTYEVENCFFDCGANMMQTTIICHDPNEVGILSSWQVLDPAEWEKVVSATTAEDFAEIVKKVRSSRFFGDR